MNSAAAVLTALLAVAGPRTESAKAAPTNPTLEHCLVSIKDEVEVPAQEPGVLVKLATEEGQPIIEGMQVEQGQSLGLIDDRQRQMERRLAALELKAAQEKAANDVNIRYAKAASGVAESEYQQAVEANRRVPGTYPATEIRRLKLAWNRAYLQIEQSELEQHLTSIAAEQRGAEVEAAEVNIARRRIEAPLGGEIVSVAKHIGEWVAPGDPVVRIVRFDTLRVEGFLSAAQYDPAEVADRPVRVSVPLAHGRRAAFEGRIVYVSPLVQAGGQYRVWAEVANRRENNQWLLRPGLTAEMTIEVKP